eukprot:7393410-Alexandrium_andersonii.AAC.1
MARAVKPTLVTPLRATCQASRRPAASPQPARCPRGGGNHAVTHSARPRPSTLQTCLKHAP